MTTIKNLNHNFPVISGFAAVIITLMLLVFVTGTTKLINIPMPDIGPKPLLIEYTKPPEPLPPPPQENIVRKPVDFTKTAYRNNTVKTAVPVAAIPAIPKVNNSGNITLARTKPNFELAVPKVSEVFTTRMVDMPPRVMRPVNPIYPFEAKADGIEGKVTLRFVVDENGNVQNPEVIKADPEGVFDEAALDAIIRYRFVPAKLGGEAVKCYAVLPMGFKINK